MNSLDQEPEKPSFKFFVYNLGEDMLTVQVFKGEMSKYPGGYKLWYVRLVSPNGEIIAVSEGYGTKWNAKRAAKKNFPEAKLVVLE